MSSTSRAVLSRKSSPPAHPRNVCPRLGLALTVLAVGFVAFALSPAALAQKPQEEGIGLLFAQTAKSATMKPVEGTPRFKLKLYGVNSQVVWFSDRPARNSGHIQVADFTRSWAGFGFDEVRPNAALTLLHGDDGADTVVVELGTPRYNRKQHTLHYSAKILDEATGNLSHLASQRDRRVPRHFRSPSLFIDDAAATVVNGCVIAPYTWCNDGDLHGASLWEVNLTGANLARANLSDADLSGADLSGADLSGANLDDAKLPHANLTDANLTDANLYAAYLEGAKLTDANLTGANLFYADLTDADVWGKDLAGAKLCETTLPNGRITNSDC